MKKQIKKIDPEVIKILKSEKLKQAVAGQIINKSNSDAKPKK